MKKLIGVLTIVFCLSFLPGLLMAEGCGETAISGDSWCYCCIPLTNECWIADTWNYSQYCGVEGDGSSHPYEYCTDWGERMGPECPGTCPWYTTGFHVWHQAYSFNYCYGAEEALGCQTEEIEKPTIDPHNLSISKRVGLFKDWLGTRTQRVITTLQRGEK